MTTGTGQGSQHAAWNVIDREKRLDRIIRWVCAAAWGVTFILTGIYAYFVSQEVSHLLRLRVVGNATSEAVRSAIIPLVIAIGILALLIAALSTVGVFLRSRTATLAEIQLRLAMLEERLGRGDGDG